MSVVSFQILNGDDLSNRIIGTSQNDMIYAGGGDDAVFGGYGQDAIYGGDGNDLLWTGTESSPYLSTGAETLDGGAGDDTMGASLSNLNDLVIDGGAGEDTVFLYGTITLGAVSYTLGEFWNAEHVELGSIRMNANDNVFYLSEDLLSVTGGYYFLEGNDQFYGGRTTGGAFYGGDGKDTLSGSGFLEGGGGKDLLIATSGKTTFSLTANDIGIDEIQHVSGKNLLYLNLGNNGHIFGENEFALIADFETVVILGSIQLGVGSQVFDAGSLNLDPSYGLNLYGGMGNDSLVATGMADILDGGEGDDTLVGGAGNDTYFIDAIGDVIVEFAGGGIDGIHLLSGNISTDDLANIESVWVDTPGLNVTLVGGNGNNAFTANTGNDFLDGGDGNDQLTGGGGNDTMIGGRGSDTFSGGKGDDVFYIDKDDQIYSGIDSGGFDTVYISAGQLSEDSFSGASGKVFEKVIYTGSGNFTFRGTEGGSVFATEIISGAGNDSIYSGSGADTIRSGDGDDVLKTSGGDLVEAGSGNDKITGYERGPSGGDTLKGGAGDDVYYVYDSTTLIVESSGEGTDTIYFYEGTFTLGKNIENAIADYGKAAAKPVVLIGNGLNNFLEGGIHSDDLTGAGGNDTLVGDDGHDLLDGGNGNDSLDGGDGNDQLFGGAGANVMIGGRNDDLLVSSTGDDSQSGGAGNDKLDAGGGDDTLDGAEGRDTLYGGDGNDHLTGGDEYDLLDAGEGNNTVSGGAGNDVIVGWLGTDLIDAGAGDDTIYYLGGADKLTGGSGYDAFVFEAFSKPSGPCVIEDFQNGQDILFLDKSSGLVNSLPTGPLSVGAFVSGTSAKDSTDRIIHDKATGQIWYDADGSGKATKQLLCKVDPGIVLDAADFWIF